MLESNKHCFLSSKWLHMHWFRGISKVVSFERAWPRKYSYHTCKLYFVLTWGFQPPYQAYRQTQKSNTICPTYSICRPAPSRWHLTLCPYLIIYPTSSRKCVTTITPFIITTLFCPQQFLSTGYRPEYQPASQPDSYCPSTTVWMVETCRAILMVQHLSMDWTFLFLLFLFCWKI